MTALRSLGLALLVTCAAGVPTVGAQESVIYNRWDVLAAIDDASALTGVSASWLAATVRCEAPGLNPYAVGRQGELGPAQLHPRGLLPAFYAAGYANPFNPYEAIEFMALRFAAGGSRAWSCA